MIEGVLDELDPEREELAFTLPATVKGFEERKMMWPSMFHRTEAEKMKPPRSKTEGQSRRIRKRIKSLMRRNQ